MRRRDLRLDSYGIDNNAYRELMYFCLQYPTKKAKIESRYTPPPAPPGQHGASQCTSQPERTAMLNDKLLDDCHLIEQTAMEAAKDLHPFLMENVTRGIPLRHLHYPGERDSFYDMRRYFFFRLAQKMGKA